MGARDGRSDRVRAKLWARWRRTCVATITSSATDLENGEPHMSFARVRALVVIAALTVAAIIFVVIAVVRDSQTGAATAAGCPDGFVIANIALPESKDVKVKVFNATGIAGQGQRV